MFEDRVEAAFGVVVGIAVAGRIKARQAKAHPVVVVAGLGRGEAGADLRRPAGEDAVPVLAQRGIEAGGQVDPPDPPVSAVAQIDGVVIAPAQIAEQRRTDREAVVVDMAVAFFAVDVRRRADLAGPPDEGKILPVAVGGPEDGRGEWRERGWRL